MGPRSLEALLPQLPKRIAEGQPEELCEFIREKPQGSDAITLHDNDLTESNLPQSYNGLTSLSRIVTHLLLSEGDPADLLTQVRQLAALRLGLSMDSLVATSSQGQQIELWDYRTQTQPTLVARLPACEPADFGTFDETPLTLPEGPLPARPIPKDFAYLNLGKVGEPFSFSDALEASQDTQLSLPSFSEDRTTSSSSASASTTRDLSALTYNLALLNYKMFGFVPVRQAPHVPERRTAALRNVFGSDDIIAFQEIWNPPDGQRFAERADASGYRYFDPPKLHASNGLGIAIRKQLIAPGYPVTHRNFTFTEQLPREYLAATLSSLGFQRGIKRGFQIVQFTTPQRETIAIVNTHFTAYRENWRYRLSQAEDISKAIQSVEADTVILLGDLNGDIHYSGDTFTADDGEEVHGWLVNARSTPMISVYAELQDWTTIGFGQEFISKCYSQPISNRDQQCEPTWDHGNLVVRAQYPVSREPQARLDFILGRSRFTLNNLTSSRIFQEVFTLPGGNQMHISDHYGVRVKFTHALPTGSPSQPSP